MRIGDVLRTPTDSFRIVRDVRFNANGFLTMVDFTIKHCSWTGRCYTCCNRSDLRSRGFRPTGKRKRLTSRLDKRIARHMLDHRLVELDCCDVKGID